MNRELFEVGIDEAIEELKRERTLRRGVYPRWISHGKLSKATAEIRMSRLNKAIDLLETQRALTIRKPPYDVAEGSNS